MKLDVAFDFASVTNFESISVASGQTFTVSIQEKSTVKWFLDNDPVLEAAVLDEGSACQFTAKTAGTSTILLVHPTNTQVLQAFTIAVVEPISLNPRLVSVDLKSNSAASSPAQ